MRTVRAILVVLAAGVLVNGVALANDGYTYSGGDAIAESGPLGIGFASFNGNGYGMNALSGKLLLGDKAAFQGVIGLGWGSWGFGLSAGLDYIMDVGTLADVDVFRLNWYAGAGGMLGLSSWSGMSIGISGVFGLSFRLKVLPIEFAVDVRPTFLLGGWSSRGGLPFDIWACGAVRWYL